MSGDTMAMATVTGWHFAAAKFRDGRPLPKRGDVLTHDGPVVPCGSGYHASESALDALLYAPGAMVARVRLSGEVVAHDGDKHAASVRENLTDYVDASRVLHEFACDCAERALNREEKAGRKVDPRSREAIACKRRWLAGEATDEERSAARAAARAAARDAARAAAWYAARAAAWDAARAAAWAAAWDAARAAAWAAAGAAAWDAALAAAGAAALDAAWDAAWDAERDWHRAELERRLTLLLKAER